MKYYYKVLLLLLLMLMLLLEMCSFINLPLTSIGVNHIYGYIRHSYSPF